MCRKCSLGIRERPAERLTGVRAWDGEREQALVADVCHDDLAVAPVPIPFERDRVISLSACVQFDEHDRLFPGCAHRTCEPSLRGIDGSGCAAGRPAASASAFAGLVLSRTPRPRVGKLMDQRMRCGNGWPGWPLKPLATSGPTACAPVSRSLM